MTEAQVMVQVQVLPPYSTYLPDYFNYENRVVLTLISMNGQANVKLSATIQGDNGISVSSNPQYMPPVPIHLDQNVMVALTGGDLQNYFDYNSAVVTGIDKNTLFHGSGIPEGVYTLCIRALDYATGASLSDPSPAGCSNSFEIKYVDPPVLISPSCGDSISPDNQQNIVFSWVPSQGTPVTTQYKFKMVELIPPNRNPNDAMNSATTPPFYETMVNSLVFVYGPSEPFLQPGHSYAWRVTAVDVYSIQPNTTGSIQYVNNGASEVCWFNEKTGEQPVTQVDCDCHCSPVIYPVLKQGNKWTYDAGGTYSCSGYCPAGQDATACVIIDPPVSYIWHIGAGNDVVASIVGPVNGKSVELKIIGKGNFNLYVNATLTCSCKTCSQKANLEQSVPVFPPPTGCLCEIQSEIIGGDPIKVVNPLAAYVKPRVTADGKPVKNQTLAVGLSVLATDNDDLIHRCILAPPWEKLIEKVGDRVSYAWTLEKGADAKIIGEKQGTAMLILPYDIKLKKDPIEYRIKCTISSNADDDLTGYVNVKVFGADTCDYITLEPVAETMSKGTKKTRELKKPGLCEPDDKLTWKKADPIAAILTVPAFVPVGEVTLIRLDAFDSDRLTIRCVSKKDGCGNPEKTIELFEGLVFKWSDGDAGGTFEPVANGNGALYRAPDKTGEVTITCKINDAGNHFTASGEDTTVTGKIKVVDVMRALFMGLDPDSAKQQFLTVGPDTRLWPAFIKNPEPEFLKSDWCLDLGGPAGMMKASVLKGKTPMKAGDLILHIQKATGKDNALYVYWSNHHHIHDIHPLICKTTYRFPKNDIPYIDGDWKKSNFLEGEPLDTFKLFFDGRVKARNDDGKWRTEAAPQKDDVYGEKAVLWDTPDVPPWLLHWAEETYGPSKHGYSLKSKDPKILYNSSFQDAFGVYPTAEYRWKGSYNGNTKEDIMYISDLAIAASTRKAFSRPDQTVISSNMKITTVNVFLPKINIVGIASTIRCINHELAHWEAITANWRKGGTWEKRFGEHTFYKPWQDVKDGRTVNLKEIKYEGTTRKYLDFSVASGGDVKAVITPVPEKGDAKIMYSMTITCTKVKNDIKPYLPVDDVVLTLPRAWFVEDEGKEHTSLSSGDLIYSDTTDGIILARTRRNGKEVKTDEFRSPKDIHNGVVIVMEGSNKFKVYERHNDPDGDWIPNAVEDKMGTNWLSSKTYPEGTGHLAPNDQEFWAEWRIRDLFDKETGRLMDSVEVRKKDWANPGMQTEVKKK